jgi:hypothetical protein
VAKKKRLLGRKRDWLALRERMIKPWRFAIEKLRQQIGDDCLTHAAEQRRFQNRRLIENLHSELLSSRSPRGLPVMAYWLFCGSPWQDQLGYHHARQQHYAELKALGVTPEFGPPQFQTKPQSEALLVELLFRLDSLASWIEAQESWIFWRGLSSQPATWDRHDAGARSQAIDAAFIARLPKFIGTVSDSFIAGLIGSFRKCSKPQWVKVLKMAARIAERGEQPVKELDTWVWWRYPVFMRYHWSAAEVCFAAEKKFGEIDDIYNVAAFKAAWVRRGLRFTGRKTRQKSPPLWDFVINEQVPRNVSLEYPLLDWIPYENSSLQT